jgi:NAD-dependent deacetylase sirtuin 4
MRHLIQSFGSSSRAGGPTLRPGQCLRIQASTPVFLLEHGKDDTAMPLIRIPYTSPLPAPRIIPPSASTSASAVAALVKFLTASNAPSLRNHAAAKTLLLTGAGLSVASGLADYRGTNGTYTLNKTYRPIYYHEFIKLGRDGHESRKRYWARSFMGWRGLDKSRPNGGHFAIGQLGQLGRVSGVITQSMLANLLFQLMLVSRKVG